jgi:hypothetical protein
LIKKDLYSISYCTQTTTGQQPNLLRAELWINDEPATYRVEGDLQQGSFVFDISQFPENPYMLCSIVLWDRIFNCTPSADVMFKIL